MDSGERVGELLIAGLDLKGVSPLLKEIVKSEGGVVSFMVKMAGKNAEVKGVTFKDLEGGTHEVGWETKDSEGKLANREWLKNQLRNSLEGQQNLHEWIPSDKIIDVIARAKSYDDTDEGAKWIHLQNKLRSKTYQIIFKPEPWPYLQSQIDERTKAGEELDAVAKGLAEETNATEFNISGHSHALYLSVDGGKKQQTTKQGAFHENLRETFDANDTIEGYAGNLMGVIDDELWAGELTFLPDPMRPYAGLIESAYESGLKGVSAKSLGELALWMRDVAREVKESVKEIVDEFV